MELIVNSLRPTIHQQMVKVCPNIKTKIAFIDGQSTTTVGLLMQHIKASGSITGLSPGEMMFKKEIILR